MNNLVLRNLTKLQEIYQIRSVVGEQENKKLKARAELITKNFKEMVETCAAARAMLTYQFLLPPFKVTGHDPQSSRNYKFILSESYPKLKSNRFSQASNQISVGVAYSPQTIYIELSGNPQADTSKINTAQEIINQLIPKFQIPTQWVEKDGVPRLQFKERATAANTLSLEQIAQAIKLPAAEHEASNPPPDRRIAISKTYKRIFNNMGFFRINIDAESSRVITDSPGDSGKLLGAPGELQLTLQIIAEVRFPKDLAYWMTFSEEDNDFIPYSFAEHFNELWAFGTPSDRRKARPSVRRSTLTHVQKLISKKKESPITSRVNSEGFVILQNGSVLFLPENENRVSAIIQQLKQAYDSKEEILKRIDLETNADSPVAVDWSNSSFIFTTRSNTLAVISLAGAKPLDNLSIYQYFRSSPTRLLENFLTIIGASALKNPETYDTVFNGLSRGMNWGNAPDPAARLAFELTRIMREEDLVFGHVLGVIELPDFENPRYAPNWPILSQAFIDLCNVAYKDFNNIDAPVPQKYGFVRLVLEIVNRYVKNFEKYKQEYSKAYQANGKIIDIDPVKVQIPNLPGLSSLMPHQNKVIAELNQTEGSAVIGVDPGGGKTIIGIADCLHLLAQGRIKRPIVIAPNNIIAEWVREIQTTSQGKVNAFPLNSLVYRRETRRAKMTDKFIVNTLKALPINTIIITDFSFLRGRSEAINYLNTRVVRYPNAEMLLQVGFDYILVDESHRIKNQQAQQTQAIYLLTTYAKYFRLASGTIISDRPSDLVGQIGVINPFILGDAKKFKDTYGRGANWDPDAAQKIARRIQPYARQINVKRREWAFLLPRIREEFHQVQMTESQRQFYKQLLDEILDQIRSDPDLLRKMEEGGEEIEAEIEQALRLYFVKLEIFINAPEANAAFAALGKIKKEDLLSPKLEKIDELVTEHLQKKKSLVENSDKIIIFGYNKAVSRHIYKHSKHSKLAVHYSAGDIDAVEKFRTNPKVQILIADETGLKEGINLQIASMMIRLQTLWSPGNQEQALARIFRPDPRGKFQRELINFHWLVADNSIEIAKTARLISKIITKAKFDEEGNSSFQREVSNQLEDLPLVSMNLKTIEDYTSINDLTGDTGRGNFFGSYATLKQWEDNAFESSQARLKEKIQKKLGKAITDKDIKTLAMTPVDGDDELPNSRGSFQPWLKNITPTDYSELKLIPLLSPEEDGGEDEDNEDDDDGDDDTVVNVEKGDLVLTEYGPGYIRTAGRRSVRVDVPGFARGIRIVRANVYIATNAKGARKLAEKLKKAGKRGLPKITMKGANLDLPDLSDLEDDKKGQKQLEDKTGRKSKVKPGDVTAPDISNSIYLHVALINGIVTLITDAVDEDASSTMPKLGYHYIEDSYYQVVRSYRAFDRYLTRMDDLYTREKINLRDSYWEELLRMQEIYKANRKNLGRVKKTNFKEIQRNFLLMSHRKPKDRKTLRPYSLVWDGELLVLYNVQTQNLNLLRKSFNNVQGVSKISRDAVLAPSYIKMLRNKTAIKKELKAIRDRGLIVQNLSEFEEERETILG